MSVSVAAPTSRRSRRAPRAPRAVVNTNSGSRDMQQLLDAGAADSTYAWEWAKYTKWIDDNHDDVDILAEFPDMGPPPGDDYGGDGTCYITRDNLDAYFTNVVVYRSGGTGHIRRIEQALKWFALHKENHLLDANVRGPNFVSDIMKAAVAAQKVLEKERGSVGAQVDDKCPHRFCKHTLSITERLKVMKAAMGGNDWRNAAVAVNLGHNVALRGASTRMLTLSDLRLADGYGPGSNKSPGDPRFDRTLMLILRKGKVHKDRFRSTKQVGFWRHRNWLLDPNFSIGLAVLYSLRRLGESIDFKLRPAGGNVATTRPLWWDLPLIEWKELKGKPLLLMIISVNYLLLFLTRIHCSCSCRACECI